MRKLISCVLASLTMLGTHAASAQETPAPASKDFAGFRAEANIGYDRTGDDALYGEELGGLRVGGAIGYDAPLGNNFLVGIEAGIGWTVTGGVTVGPFATNDPTTFHVTGAHDADISVRLGTKIGPKTLAFVKAGWVDTAYRSEIVGEDYSFSSEGNDDNLRLGIGVEHRLGKSLYAKAEYRYTAGDAGRHQLLAGLGIRF
ncbi:outer membrane immunogenic protein [Sphingomonas naasensis]|uniref:Porin family protein n=1 Tax=Sphingomonas naasensis TaxID=1344951 RepID=A0A4S1WS36_9SPHN|nr:porin family protein [Sphingomonas naasensis]NIJ18998.1 outer membrane immunogenic protein [Sphingomonas naasensis]TGX46204.1 porin family protein [Sphingomonas naasensis]